MALRVICLAAVLLSVFGACLPEPTPHEEACSASLASATGENLDKSPFAFADGCAEVEELNRTGFHISFAEGGPISSLSVDGRNPEDLDLNAVGEYECDSYLMRLRAVGHPTDPENPAYDSGAYDTLNQNTAVEGDCLYGACTVSVTSPASSGTLKLHFTGHLGRGKAGAVPPFRCDYMDFSFDLTANVTQPLE